MATQLWCFNNKTVEIQGDRRMKQDAWKIRRGLPTGKTRTTSPEISAVAGNTQPTTGLHTLYVALSKTHEIMKHRRTTAEDGRWRRQLGGGEVFRWLLLASVPHSCRCTPPGCYISLSRVDGDAREEVVARRRGFEVVAALEGGGCLECSIQVSFQVVVVGGVGQKKKNGSPASSIHA